MSSPSDLQRAGTALIQRWGSNPTLFALEALGVRFWHRQAEIAQAVVRFSRTAAKSGHKVGKSTLDAVLAIWWALTRARGRAILTAPAGHQIQNVLWPEVRRIYRNARFPLGGHCSPDPWRGLLLPGDRSVICVVTDEPEKLAGLSGPDQLFIVDEASGFAEKLWPAIFGNLAGGGRVLATGNPTQVSGTFAEAFHEKAHLWAGYTISSIESPNVVEGRDVYPGLARRAWVLEMLEEHAGVKLPADAPLAEIIQAVEAASTGAPFLEVRVLGRPPSQASNAVIPLALVEAARQRYDETRAEGPLSIGVDPARFGDDESTIAPRRGNKLFPIEAHRKLDGAELAAQVRRVIDEHRKPDETPLVKVDVIGVGASCFDFLRAGVDKGGYRVVGVNTGEASDQPDKYRNLRAQLHFGMRLWLLEGGAIPPDDQKLHAELVAPKYSLDEKSRYVVEKKDDIKERLRRSPDRADAAALAVYGGKRGLTYDPKHDKSLPGFRQ